MCGVLDTGPRCILDFVGKIFIDAEKALPFIDQNPEVFVQFGVLVCSYTVYGHELKLSEKKGSFHDDQLGD
jgi:hypothetical protein